MMSHNAAAVSPVEFYTRVVREPVFRPYPNPSFEWAAEHINRGRVVVPIPFRMKMPIIKEWQNLEISDGNLADHFNSQQLNIGVILGERSGWLVDVDLDSPEAVKMADFFLPQTASKFGRKSKPSSHRLYVCKDAEYAKFNDPLMVASRNDGDRKNACIVEIRTGKGKQTVFPGSIHESGESIGWVTNGEPLQITFVELGTAVNRLAAASLLVKYWKEGIRHELSLAVAGTLLRHGFSERDAKQFIRAICFAANDDESSDRMRVVEDTAVAKGLDSRTYGLPKLVELTDQKIVDAFCTWLGIGKDSLPAKATAPSEDRFKVVCMKDVTAEKVEWIWEPFIPIGEFTIMEGIEGIGKSWIGCALACAIASGAKLPFHNGDPHRQARVLLLSAEDSLSHTIRPRLESMSADLEKIFAIDEVFSLNDTLDVIWFEGVLAEYHPKLVFIDPMFSYTAGKDLNAESSSRPIARKLIALAQKYNCAIVGVRHVGKSKGLGDARNAGLGSISWRASARSVLLVGQDGDTGERAICQTKNNLAEQSTLSVGFDIIDGKFLFSGKPSALTKERMLAQAKDPDTKIEQSEAVEFLQETLRTGDRPSKEIEKEAKDLGITQYAMRKAKHILGIKPFKKGGTFGGDKSWHMRLPGSAEVVDIREFQHLQENHRDKKRYDNDLAEDVEKLESEQVQQDNSTSSDDKPTWSNAVCVCGEVGKVGHSCRNCGEIVLDDV